jgi:hypothetical protein
MPVAVPTATPSALPTAEPSVATSGPAPFSGDVLPSLTPAPTPRATAFPDIALIAGGILGELQVYRAGRWSIEVQVCPNADPHNAVRVLEVSADGRTAFIACSREAGARDTVDAFVYDFATKEKRAIGGITLYGAGPISPDGKQLVVGGPGDCPMPAPVCQTRWYLLDLATGARSEILPSDYWLSIEFRWAPDGLTYFRPECAPAGCAGTEKAGTYRYGFTTRTWTRISAHRIVATAPDHTIAEQRRSLDTQASTHVIERVLGQERMLTPAGVEREFALGLLLDGRTIAWRPDTATGFDGEIVAYRDGREERRARGRFSAFMSVGTTSVGASWLFAGELSGAPSWKIHAYSVEQDAFASVTPTFQLQQFRILPKALGPSKVGACTTPGASTRSVIERYFALRTSGDGAAVNDCFTIAWRARNTDLDESSARWASSDLVTSLDVSLVDRTHGCDRYSVSARTRDSAMGFYLIVGPDGDRPRIRESGTALVRSDLSTTRCD